MMTSVASHKRGIFLAALAFGLILLFTGLMTFAFSSPSTPAHADEPDVQLNVSYTPNQPFLSIDAQLSPKYQNRGYRIRIAGDPYSCGNDCSGSHTLAESSSETIHEDIDLRSIRILSMNDASLKPLSAGKHIIYAWATSANTNEDNALESSRFIVTIDNKFNVTGVQQKVSDSGSSGAIASAGDSTTNDELTTPMDTTTSSLDNVSNVTN